MSIQSLFSHAIAAWFVLAFALTMTACVSQTPTPKYPNEISIAVFNTHDDNGNLTSSPLPEVLAATMIQPIADRNLTVKNIAFENVESQITRTRDTSRRSQILAQTAENSQILLINEIETEFYSVLSGRYRWNVNVKLSIYDLTTGDTLSDVFTIPAVLMYAHEKGDDAIQSVSAEIQRHVGSLVDKFMTGRTIDNNAARKDTPLPQKTTDDGSNGADRGAPPDVADESAHTPKTKAIYFVLIDRFFNAQNDGNLKTNSKDPNAWHGGDLEGIRQKLPYLKELGITDIWLSPAFYTAEENFFGHAAFHGYWTYDLSKIDPHFGSERDLVALAQDAQKFDISLLLDFVVNHVGYGSPLVEEKPDWFHPALTIEDWNDPKQLVERQVHGLPDLNQDNPEVYSYLIDSAQKWLKIPNISGLRLDAVKHVDIDFWKRFNTTLKELFPDIMLLGEYFDGDPKKVDDVQKAGSFTHLFDFPLAFALRDVYCENKSLANLASTIANDRLYTHPNDMVTFIDNHDMPRFISLCKGDKAAMRNALKVLLSWRGIPSVYYGTENPLAGFKEPDNRADMIFENQSFFSFIRDALKQRNAHPVLAFGKTNVLNYEKDFAVLYRHSAGTNESAIILLSQSNAPKTYKLPEGKWQSLDDNTLREGAIEIAPKSVSIFAKEGDVPLDVSNEKIVFNIPQDGTTYAITGSIPELGSWNPANAPKSTGEPIVVEIPKYNVVLFKLVKIKNNKHQWSKKENSELFVDGSKTIETTF